MDVMTVNSFMVDFLKSNEHFYGPTHVTITEKPDAALFPDELDKLQGKRCGLYMISTKWYTVVRYVGISKNIELRIYQHMGSQVTWPETVKLPSFQNAC